MIEGLIDFLNAKLSLTNYFEKQYCLSEYIKKGAEKFPAMYKKDGEYERVDFDAHDGVSYFAKNGNVSLSRNEENLTGCEILYNLTIPLKLVCFINREKLSKDDQYSDDRLATSIIKQLTTNTALLKNNLKAKRISITASNYNTSKDDILSSEYEGVSFAFKYKYSYISIDLEFQALVNNACILGECEFDQDILHSFNFCDESVLARLTDEQMACLASHFGGLCVDVTVKNSDESYLVQVASGETLILPDTEVNVFLDGVLQTTQDIVTLGNDDINIIWD